MLNGIVTRKEYCVCGYNKKVGMSGFYSVPKKFIKEIQKGSKLFSEHCGEISEIEALGLPHEVEDTGREEDLVYYNRKVVGI